MRQFSKVDGALGAVVGAILGAMAGAALVVVQGKMVNPGSIQWYYWVMTMVLGAIVGFVMGLITGVRSIFDWR